MSTPDRPRVRGTAETRPEETLDPAKKKPERPARGSATEERKPAFRFARLDGRDTLKYEDTADK
jgi:hypothetical protein